MQLNNSSDVADRQAIADIIHRYAYNVRHGKPAACADLFCEDAQYLMRSASPLSLDAFSEERILNGRAEIVEFLCGISPEIRVVPFISNILIEIHGNEVSSTCLMTNRIYPNVNGVTGEYQDWFRYEDCWRISRRIFVTYLDN